jgi:drug/metabolite transporter (DMT)-like permease
LAARYTFAFIKGSRMNALWGLTTALCWGSADFIARFTGRALGYQVALFGMLSVGALIMTAIVWLADLPLVWTSRGWWLIVLTGLGVMVATLLLYWGLVRGPVTVVAPIVGSYPAFNIALALLLGTRPSLVQWLAIIAVMTGVIVVAASAGGSEKRQEYAGDQLRRTIVIALSASFGFALTVAAAQYAKPIYGELQTIWMARWVSLLLAVIVLAWRRTIPYLPMRWWPLLLAQGLLDAGASLALLAGSHGENNEITAVIASTFSAVTVLLAWLILRENMTWRRWSGIAMIISGVAVLSVY